MDAGMFVSMMLMSFENRFNIRPELFRQKNCIVVRIMPRISRACNCSEAREHKCTKPITRCTTK